MTNIIVKKYEHFNRAMGKYITSKKHYEKEMAAGGFVPFEKGEQMAESARAKNHKNYFLSLEKYYSSPNWDESGKDVSRACFESYDPDIYINEESSLWTELEEPEIEEVGVIEPVVKLTSSNQIVQNLLTWWSKKYGMTKGAKNSNLHRLASAFNTFGISHSDALHECMKFDEGGKQKEIESLVKSAYKRTTNTTNSIVCCY